MERTIKSLLGHSSLVCTLGAAMLFSTTAIAEDLSLDGKKIGVAVVGTQHFWDRLKH